MIEKLQVAPSSLLSNTAELLGDGQLRLSNMGPDGDPDYDAFNPDVVYNSTDNEYMVVWEGDSSSSTLTDNEFEIFGQRLNASGGKMGYSGFRITHMGTDADPERDAGEPAIAYDSADNQYFVVWQGEGVGADVFDILGQRLQNNGVRIGNVIYLSNYNGGANLDYDAYNPDVAYDSLNNQYFTVWYDDELIDSEFEIFGQLIDASTGQNVELDTRLSDMGIDGQVANDAQSPAIANGGIYDEHTLIVWDGDNATDGEFEIWSQSWVTTFRACLPLVTRGF